ncbi:CMP-sialic acid transporter 5 [Apostasia shenzhenica]|uniref:CMP-sialic acid transporter 5 n=1 Tax=Apostasia shenzhenica TaxID=1088818 RepID=A0A2I0AY90_9ASPA|nr:CMP-sialic acid transporter 5 [Apostasia shenzhenica]
MATAVPVKQRKDRANSRVWVYLLLLTLQYGAQPLLSKRFVRDEVIVTSAVLACEAAKVTCALILLAKEGSLRGLYNQWTLIGSLTASGLPAAIYAQKQSGQQVGALILLVIAAILLSVGEGSSKGSAGNNADQVLFNGIIPVMVASVLSGLASSLCQWASQVKKHTSYLMTVEMSIVGSLCLLASMYKSPDGEAIRKNGFFYGWTPWTFVNYQILSFICFL